MSAEAIDVTVVVTTRNRAAQLGELLAGLRAQHYSRSRFEVVVVDDGSTDSTHRVLAAETEQTDLQLRVIQRSESGGAAIGREEGWRAARAELIAFTDDDCVPDPGWLEAGLAASSQQPGAIIQGRTAPRPDELHRLGPFARTMDVRALDHTFPTTNIFYPKDVLRQIGGFDIEAFARAVGGEDTDLAWRAIAAGVPAVYCDEALVYHAVNELGPFGKLRVAARSTAAIPYARHSEIRRAHFVHGVFRKPTHWWLALACVGLFLPRRLGLLRAAFAVPYFRSLRARGKIEGGGLRMAPYFLVHDLVESYATLRGGLHEGVFML